MGRRVPVELDKTVGRVLCVAFVAGKLIAHQIVAHVIGTCRKRTYAGKCVVIHGAHAVLRVVIVANVLACLRVQVALIILIEEVCKLNIIGLCELIVAL